MQNVTQSEMVKTDAINTAPSLNVKNIVDKNSRTILYVILSSIPLFIISIFISDPGTEASHNLAETLVISLVLFGLFSIFLAIISLSLNSKHKKAAEIVGSISRLVFLISIVSYFGPFGIGDGQWLLLPVLCLVGVIAIPLKRMDNLDLYNFSFSKTWLILIPLIIFWPFVFSIIKHGLGLGY